VPQGLVVVGWDPVVLLAPDPDPGSDPVWWCGVVETKGVAERPAMNVRMLTHWEWQMSDLIPAPCLELCQGYTSRIEPLVRIVRSWVALVQLEPCGANLNPVDHGNVWLRFHLLHSGQRVGVGGVVMVPNLVPNLDMHREPPLKIPLELHWE
jgi:hypothetical protein